MIMVIGDTTLLVKLNIIIKPPILSKKNYRNRINSALFFVV